MKMMMTFVASCDLIKKLSRIALHKSFDSAVFHKLPHDTVHSAFTGRAICFPAERSRELLNAEGGVGMLFQKAYQYFLLLRIVSCQVIHSNLRITLNLLYTFYI